MKKVISELLFQDVPYGPKKALAFKNFVVWYKGFELKA